MWGTTDQPWKPTKFIAQPFRGRAERQWLVRLAIELDVPKCGGIFHDSACDGLLLPLCNDVLMPASQPECTKPAWPARARSRKRGAGLVEASCSTSRAGLCDECDGGMDEDGDVFQARGSQVSRGCIAWHQPCSKTKRLPPTKTWLYDLLLSPSLSSFLPSRLPPLPPSLLTWCVVVQHACTLFGW